MTNENIETVNTETHLEKQGMSGINDYEGIKALAGFATPFAVAFDKTPPKISTAYNPQVFEFNEMSGAEENFLTLEILPPLNNDTVTLG